MAQCLMGADLCQSTCSLCQCHSVEEDRKNEAESEKIKFCNTRGLGDSMNSEDGNTLLLAKRVKQ